MSPRRPSPPVTVPPPPPDPIDAAEAALARAEEANQRFADADDYNEPTGQFPVFVRMPEASLHDEDIPKRSAAGPASAIFAGLVTIATVLAAILHGLGWL